MTAAILVALGASITAVVTGVRLVTFGQSAEGGGLRLAVARPIRAANNTVGPPNRRLGTAALCKPPTLKEVGVSRSRYDHEVHY